MEDEESKMPLKFQALVTRRWKPGECLREVLGREPGYGEFGVRLGDWRWWDMHVKM